MATSMGIKLFGTITRPQNWVLLLIVIICTFHHWWSSGAFFLKCCPHWSFLILQSGNFSSFLHSREGVMQWEPLAMFADGIGIIPLIKQLKEGFTYFNQTWWYVDDSSALDMFAKVELYYNSLKRFCLICGYYPKPYKRVLIVYLDNLEPIKCIGFSHRFKVCTGARYLGVFIGYY